MATDKRPDDYDEDMAPATSFNLTDLTRPTCQTNFKGDPREQWAFESYAKSPACGRGRELEGKELHLVYWLVHEVHLPDKDGVPQPVIRTVLVDADRKFWGFTSQGIYESLRSLLSHLGTGPYDPPVSITIQGQGTSGSKRMLFFVPTPIRSKGSKS